MNVAIRSMLDFNRDIFAQDPYQLGFYTPIDTGLEGLDPVTTAKFLSGLGGPAQWFSQRGTFMSDIEKVGGALPFGGTAETLLGIDPYSNKATKKMPGWERGLLSVPAIYPTKKVKGVNEPARQPRPAAAPPSQPASTDPLFAPVGSQ